jgi:hypothetical protein
VDDIAINRHVAEILNWVTFPDLDTLNAKVSKV